MGAGTTQEGARPLCEDVLMPVCSTEGQDHMPPSGHLGPWPGSSVVRGPLLSYQCSALLLELTQSRAGQGGAGFGALLG